jgi:hypothetical protein
MISWKNSVGYVIVILVFWVGFFLGQFAFKTPVKAEVYEEEFHKELDSIYRLLASMSATQRLNMNLSLKTNHYLEHEFNKDICPDCLKHYRYLVDNMPELPEQQQQTFDMLYSKPLQEIESLKGSVEK